MVQREIRRPVHFEMTRRTNASAIRRATSNIRAVQLLFGHAKLESTVRYLGLEIEDALSIAKWIEL